MRLLIISTFFPPLNSIASLRPYSWAKYWTLAGHDVTVLTQECFQETETSLQMENPGFKVIAVPVHPIVARLKQNHQKETEGKKQAAKFGKRMVLKFFDWLRFKRGVFNACRFPDFTHLWIKPALKAIQNERGWDAVISTAGPYSTHMVADAIKHTGLAKRWVADYRDTWSNNYIYPGIFPLNWLEHYWEKWMLKRADAITTISAPFARQIAQHLGVKSVVTVENGYDSEDLKKLPSEFVFPNDGKVRIVHTGSIYLGKRDPSPLFKAIKELSQTGRMHHLQVLFVGPRQANLEELINKYQVENWVKLTGFVSREEALCMQRDAHALLFLPWNDPEVDGVLTGKIFEYLSSGTPIVSIGSSHMDASQRLIEEAKGGTICLTVDSIKVFLDNLLSQKEKKPAGMLEHVVQRFERKYLANKMLEHIKSE